MYLSKLSEKVPLHVKVKNRNRNIYHLLPIVFCEYFRIKYMTKIKLYFSLTLFYDDEKFEVLLFCAQVNLLINFKIYITMSKEC